MQAYHQSASTLNLLRAFTKGGFADLSRVAAWNQEFVASSSEGQRYSSIASEIERALRFMAACGIDLAAQPPAPRGRLLHEPRSADPRLRRGAHPHRLADRSLVRLLGPHALDRRAHAPARRRARRVPPRRRQPDRLQGRPDGDAERGARAVRAAEPRPGAGRLTLDRAHGRRSRRGAAAARCCAP